MSDRFRPWSAATLAAQMVHEMESSQSILGIPLELVAPPPARLATTHHGEPVAAPLGVAAGPHCQLAGNIVTAWLCGARVIELKTVQVLDEIDVAKPCIDMADAGYNVEWSQELTLQQSLEQYVAAWVLVHGLARRFGWPGDGPGVVFDVSVGYDMDGIRSAAIERFLAAICDAGPLLEGTIAQVAPALPEVTSASVPKRLASSVTLSTMHGCPPDEIEQIAVHLMERWRLNTRVKLNPTLLGAERVHEILGERLGWHDVEVPDSTFVHDIDLDHALPLLDRLRQVASRCELGFGVKLTNTLPVVNGRGLLPAEDGMMYMSGRPLHPLSVQVAWLLRKAVGNELEMSFAGGVDCWNVAKTLECGLRPVTVCSDLLQPGGYLRLPQYLEEIHGRLEACGAGDLDEMIVRTAGRGFDVGAAAAHNLCRYAEQVLEDAAYRWDEGVREPVVTLGRLELLDCIEAPCQAACALEQDVPAYLRAIRDRQPQLATEIIRADNPLGAVLGRACDHRCEVACVRSQLDDPLAIRDLKRFALSVADTSPTRSARSIPGAVGVIGAGPCGLAIACCLAEDGFEVTLFDRADRPGGMVSATIPGFRADLAALDQDLARLEALGVTVQCGEAVTVPQLAAAGFRWIVVATGAQHSVGLGLDGEGQSGSGVVDGLDLLRAVRGGQPLELGRQVVVVGGGDVAMDCARTAVRLGAEVRILYRRTLRELPALAEELEGALTEGVEVVELMAPRRTLLESGRLVAVECVHMRLGEPDASGRRRPIELPDQVSTIPAETLVVAIGQRPDLTCFADQQPDLTDGGWVRVDPQTMATSLPGVFAGGDLAGDGPATIVRAAADGRRIAAAIRTQQGVDALPSKLVTTPLAETSAEVAELLRRRGHRQHRVGASMVPADQREGFSEVLETYEESAAVREAARCFECDRMCSICATVCPNRAIVTWTARPRQWELAVGKAGEGAGERELSFAVTQPLQQVVLADWCNECGNCATFCPADGRPYADKPRLVRSREALVEEGPTAIWIHQADGRWRIEGSDQLAGPPDARQEGACGQWYQLEDDGSRLVLRPAAGGDRALWFDRKTLLLQELHGDGGLAQARELRTAAVLWVLLDGLRDVFASFET